MIVCYLVKVGTYTPLGLDLGCPPYRTEYMFIRGGSDLNKILSSTQRAEPISAWKIKK